MDLYQKFEFNNLKSEINTIIEEKIRSSPDGSFSSHHSKMENRDDN